MFSPSFLRPSRVATIVIALSVCSLSPAFAESIDCDPTAKPGGENSTACGASASADGANSTALGAGAVARADNSVALGSNSVADRVTEKEIVGAGLREPGTSVGEVSVGNASTGERRQVTNVASGV